MKAYDNLSQIVKLVLQFFFGGLISGVYRIIKGATTNNMTTLIVGILALFTGIGNIIFWIVDFVTILLENKIKVFA